MSTWVDSLLMGAFDVASARTVVLERTGAAELL